MPTHLAKPDFYYQVKYETFILCLKISIFITIITTIFHYFYANQRIIDLIIPPCFTLIFCVCLWYLKHYPQRLETTIKICTITLWGGIFIPITIFILESILFPEIRIVDIFPSPIFGILLPAISSIFIFMQYKNWKSTAIILYALIGVPMIAYLVLHPEELRSTRGFDIAFLFGPALVSNLALMILAIRSQELINQLAIDRMTYYVDLAERQTIHQRSMEQTYALIHNGPLQTLALLLRESRNSEISKDEIISRIEVLNTEIRAIGNILMDANSDSSDHNPPQHFQPSQPVPLQTLRLSHGHTLNLNHPLHWLLQEVYAFTLQRQLPHFQTIQVKIRDFQALPMFVSRGAKREICLWLEEALCNVGKHAVGTTRIIAIGRIQGNSYQLMVQDNGTGIVNHLPNTGTTNSYTLAQQLGGTYHRISLPQGGMICELSWPLPDDERESMICKLPCA